MYICEVFDFHLKQAAYIFVPGWHAIINELPNINIYDFASCVKLNSFRFIQFHLESERDREK